MIEIIRNLSSYRDEAFSGYFILIDQEKAFDRMNHTYIFQTLEKLGLNGLLLKLIQNLYSNITSQIMINGSLTEKIPIK